MAEHASALPAPATPEAVLAEPAIVAIADVEELDKDNLGWTKSYVASLTERLAREQAAPQPDFVMIAYVKHEIATYQELLDRVTRR